MCWRLHQYRFKTEGTRHNNLISFFVKHLLNNTAFNFCIFLIKIMPRKQNNQSKSWLSVYLMLIVRLELLTFKILILNELVRYFQK